MEGAARTEQHEEPADDEPAIDDPDAVLEPDAQAEAGFAATLRLILGFAEGHRRALVLVAVGAFIGGFAEAAVLVVIARIAFALASESTTVEVDLGPIGSFSVAVGTLLAIAAGLLVVRVALQLGQARLTSNTSANVMRNTRATLLGAYLGTSWEVQSEERQGRLQELVGMFAGILANGVMQLSTAVVALLSLLAFMITALAVSALASLAVALTAVVLISTLRPLRGALRRASARANEANLTFATEVSETAGHMQEVRVFNVEGEVRDRLFERSRDSVEQTRRAGFLSSLAPILYQGAGLLVMVGGIAVVYAAGFSRLGALGGIVLIMVRSLSYGQSFQVAYQSMHAGAPAIEFVRGELTKYQSAAVTREGEPIDKIGQLTFDHVCFSYTPGVEVLREISFELRSGEIVGVIGPSGAGKSTMLQLLLRLREPTSGRILADGRDVRALSMNDWYQRVSFVPQDAALFAGTIADNITFFRPNVERTAVERAAKLANLHDEVTAMTGGYDTSVGERGNHLSGGQRQRLCIARALVEEPDFVVFDEPTSSLDVHSEALIRETMAGLAPGSTVIVIAHRLSTLAICDRIMVILDGKLHGFDAPSRLEVENPFYREALLLSGLR